MQHLHSQSSPAAYVHLKNKDERLQHFLSIKNSSKNFGVFLFFEEPKNKSSFVHSKPTVPKPKRLEEQLGLPANFGRHYLRRYLEIAGTHQELIKYQMGHFVIGENPLSKFSSTNFQTLLTALQPTLDKMLNELGWRSIPSLLTRQRT